MAQLKKINKEALTQDEATTVQATTSTDQQKIMKWKAYDKTDNYAGKKNEKIAMVTQKVTDDELTLTIANIFGGPSEQVTRKRKIKDADMLRYYVDEEIDGFIASTFVSTNRVYREWSFN
jgi:hypothetical protein